MEIFSIILKILVSMSLFFSQAPFSLSEINYSNIDSLSRQTRINSNELEDISAEKIQVINNENISYYSKAEHEIQSIASITKLMTALVFLDNDIDLNSSYTINSNDEIDGGKRHFFVGEEIKIKDILYSALIASDNEAAAILAKVGSYDESEFVNRMNEKAKNLGMNNSKFSDPTGLDNENKSTASDVAILFNEAWNNEIIRSALALSEYNFETLQGREKKIISTDYNLIDINSNYLGGKTGFIDDSGYCFVGRFKVNSDEEIIIVILNSATKDSRFTESLYLSQIVKDKYFK